MRIAVAGDSRMVRGFALAGVKDVFVSPDAPSARETLKKWLHDPGIGIIVIPARFWSALQGDIRSIEGSRGGYPVILALPDSSGGADYAGEDYLKMAGLE
ncbi:MAG: V-type ATP synthase subunit F [Methanolinea sp.]|jgi:vacuolar-type H+-ATPase subunit F/Vma7|nr:V-type ATP synthase subunit F [Methanolinea sp.]